MRCGLARATPLLGVAIRCFAAAVVALLAALSHAQAQEVVRAPRVDGWADHKLVVELEGCPALPACLAIWMPSSLRGILVVRAVWVGR